MAAVSPSSMTTSVFPVATATTSATSSTTTAAISTTIAFLFGNVNSQSLGAVNLRPIETKRLFRRGLIFEFYIDVSLELCRLSIAYHSYTFYLLFGENCINVTLDNALW